MKLSIAALAMTSALASALASADTPLPPLYLNVEQITVSGLSSGGYMATQMHFAYSDWINGAGIIAAGPYFCARNDIKTALQDCVNNADYLPDLSIIQPVVEGWEESQKIAPLAKLSTDRVWLLSGTGDTRVAPSVVRQLYLQYQSYMPAEHLTFVDDKPFAHHFPTLKTGTDCAESEAPFIGNCQYDAAGAMLSHILPNAQPPSEDATGKLYSFDQQSLGGPSANTLADEGFVYVPEACASGSQCELHISFHGCNQNAAAVGDDYARLTGINRLADSNHLVVLYPQTKTSMFMPLNPQGCWDWWGYTGEDYATREGKQIKAVRAMALALAKSKSAKAESVKEQ